MHIADGMRLLHMEGVLHFAKSGTTRFGVVQHRRIEPLAASRKSKLVQRAVFITGSLILYCLYLLLMLELTFI